MSIDWVRKTYSKRFEHFKGECELVKDLIDETRKLNDYIAPEDREPQFDSKMERFLQLK